jgi:type 1 glutamine amidotransferase
MNRQMKIPTLVLCGDAWHPAAMVRRGFAPLANSDFAFEFVTDGRRCSSKLMDEFPLVVVAKANHVDATNQQSWLTGETQSVFQHFARNGGGLLLLHAGTCYRDLPMMRSVTGGAFLSHPEPCAVTIEPKVGHPLTAGVNAFTELDEHYFMAFDGTDRDVFAWSQSVHGKQPAGWLRSEGRGRVCALTPGHNLEVWLNPEFQKLLSNALHWAAGLN